MSFLDSFMGKSQRRDIDAGYNASQNMLREGRTAAQGALSGGLTQARATIQPYMQSGQRGQTAYENTLGLNGGQARQQQFQTGYLDDPALKYRQQQNTGMINNLLAKYNAGGFAPNSGMAMSGAGRLANEQFNTDWGGYVDRLRGLGQQGQELSKFGAGLEYGAGKDLADIETGYANTSAGNRINLANSLAQSRSIPLQNMLAIASTAAKFIPGGGGGATPQAGGNAIAMGGYEADPRRPWG